MWQNLKRLGRYVKDEYVIVIRKAKRYPDGRIPLIGVSDTNWAACRRTRKRTGCFHVSMGLQGPLMTVARTQTVIGDSSGVAEWYGGISCAAELIVTGQLAMWLGLPVRLTLNFDSAAAIGISKRIGCGKLRTLETKTLWLQQHTQGGTQHHSDGQEAMLKIFKVPGTENVADIGTKNLAAARLYELATMTGMTKLELGMAPSKQGVDCVPNFQVLLTLAYTAWKGPTGTWLHCIANDTQTTRATFVLSAASGTPECSALTAVMSGRRGRKPR